MDIFYQNAPIHANQALLRAENLTEQQKNIAPIHANQALLRASNLIIPTLYSILTPLSTLKIKNLSYFIKNVCN